MREISEEFLTMTVAKAFANKAPKGFAEKNCITTFKDKECRW